MNNHVHMKRLAVYAKDIERIMGKSPRTACTMLANIRKYYGKEKHQVVTINELCDYLGITKEEAEEFLK